MKSQNLTPMEAALLDAVTDMSRATLEAQVTEISDLAQRLAAVEAVLTSLAPLWGVSVPPTP
ncbi:hypothetical protein U879_03375 [Defluviimonas sp. 20V17]|uniref:Uncharacterized protein n=1 Tax=Allgaiera indica TaxID=765699 RepID=A0AAN4UTJ5_9RHOB|nr:hypothetical protein [Allgaiera indica]KDB05093.1 hypothetical protein U879_03375 [Defluviimonas sp. 20V17]GHE04471.1 hypothetical protein GCM10008024_31740 [Allgaiera indica]SDX56366.1 hypothetical protein SAMN05444006_12012 [Allgaiera indica]